MNWFDSPALNPYLLLKTLHILSSVVLVGTGFGTAFYLFMIHRTRNLQAIAPVARLVCKADWWFTAPAVIIQPVSGILLAHMAGWPLSTPWLALALGLYVVTGACWLPVVWLQLRLRDMAQHALETGQSTLPPLYWRYAKWWEVLGYPAFAAMMAVYYLMVVKPTF
ncbi:MAG: hypothetical protein RL748_4569 [Pseudomonadota bacterium]|jgi:uncharacterized membrane protein